MKRRFPLLWDAIRAGLLALMLIPASLAGAADLYVGSATISITPDKPVALDGQMVTRIARDVQSPVTATALALESRDGDKSLDQALFVSCDLVAIRSGVYEAVRERLKTRAPDFPLQKLILNATHTHTAPVMQEGKYDGLDESVMRPRDYTTFLADRVAEVAAQAWAARKPGSVGWGLGHAAVAQNRRSVFADGQTKMYGKTDDPNFRGLEGHEDHGIEVLFFWDRDRKLVATVVNVACPSQEVENLKSVSADFWHEVREGLQKKHGKDLRVLAWTGAAGDQSPRPLYRKAAEERMRQLRGLTRLEELARRIIHGWEEAYEGARQDIRTDVPLVHSVRTIELPRRRVTDAEYATAKEAAAALADNTQRKAQRLWNQRVVDRYEQQQRGPLAPYEMELHALRLGDVAIATNDFELFTDFGVQIKARSPAVQTFLIQLAGPGTYVPTERATRGGGYSAVIQSNNVGPDGGQALVEHSVSAIKTLWPTK